MTKAQATVAALYKGTDRALPTSGPKAHTGKNVWVISCYEGAVGCSVPAQGFVAASAHLGWKATVVDAKLDPATATQEIKSAVAAKANAIVLDGFPCSWAPGAIASAKSAGVKIYGLLSFDCPGKALDDGQLLFGKEPTSSTSRTRSEPASPRTSSTRPMARATYCRCSTTTAVR